MQMRFKSTSKYLMHFCIKQHDGVFHVPSNTTVQSTKDSIDQKRREFRQEFILKTFKHQITTMVF